MARNDDFDEDSFEDLYGDGEDPIRGLVDVEPSGPEPFEYRPVLIFTLILIGVVFCWYLWSAPPPAWLGLR